MAMEHEFARQGLESTRAPLRDLIVDFRGSDRLHIESVRGIADQGELHRSILAERRIELAGAWLPGPADRSAMQMVRVHDLRPTDHPERGRIPQVGARNG